MKAEFAMTGWYVESALGQLPMCHVEFEQVIHFPQEPGTLKIAFPAEQLSEVRAMYSRHALFEVSITEKGLIP